MPHQLETRVLLEGAEDPRLVTLQGYKDIVGGYATLERAYKEMEQDEVLKALEDSGLRGRGGAGFSMGKKASFLPRGDMPKYLCCNADESEPGAFKDRELMQRNPHQLVEGIAIAALASGAGHAFIFIRGEYDSQADVLDAAVAEAYEAGYLGKDILGTRRDLELVVHRGAGAYICGEETALLDALEGKRGNPRLKPPFPAVQGLYGGPTLINNVETLSNVPRIVAKGADWFRQYGTEQSPGTKVVSISGGVRRPGNYEISLGLPTRDLIYDLAGGPLPGRTRESDLPRRLLLPGPHRGGGDGPSLQLRGDGGSGLDARLRLGDRRRRHGLDPAHGAAHGALLPPRVVRQVRPLPRGDELDGEDARAGRPRRGDADGPRHHQLGPGKHHGQLPLRARRLDGDAGVGDGAQVPRRVRAGDGGSRRRHRPPRGRRRPGRDFGSSDVSEKREVTLTIDGREVTATEGEMLHDAAREGDVEIPVFCYEPKLGAPVGACRMCLVEIEGIPKLQTSCSTPVRDGMVVHTRTEQVKTAQNAVIEFLLVNHPLDCPVCDKGGECPLQDNTMGWGPGKSRVIDEKRHFEKPIELSPLVAIDRERCILCYRCVRFSQEISEDSQLQLLDRGDRTYVGTFDDRPYVSPFRATSPTSARSAR